MKKLFRFELLVVFLGVVGVTLFVFRQYFFGGKILFPSNLLMSTYSPWRYEPVPEYPNGPPNKPIGFDNIRQSYPDRQLLRDALLGKEIPLWNPYIYSGAPYMAASATAVWYPLSWIAALLPTIEGWNFLVVIQPIASVMFMYLFLRSMKFGMPVALFGSFAYALGGWMIVYWQEFIVLEHSFLWLPLALFASNSLWERKNAWSFILLVAAFACSVFGGFLQMAMYVYGVVVLWNVFLFFRERKRPGARGIFGFIMLAITCSLLISGIQLIPSIEAFLLSPRGAGDGSFVFRDDLLPLSHFVTLLAPDYWGNPATYNYFGGKGFYFEKMIFIGVIPLVFALYGMITGKQKTALFWTVLGLVSFSMGFALPTSWLPYYLHIPILSSSYPTRIFAVSAFSFVILACYGLEAFLTIPDRKHMRYILAALSLMLFLGWLVVAGASCIHVNYQTNALWCRGATSVLWDWMGNVLHIREQAGLYATVSLRNLIAPTMFLSAAWALLAILRWPKNIVYILVLSLTIVSSLYFASKYVYFGERRFVYPNLPVIEKLSELSGYDRVWGYGNAFIEKNFPEYFGWFSTDGYSNLSSRRYAELIATVANNGTLGGVIRRSDTDLYEASEMDPFGSTNPYRLRLMSLLGVQHVLEAKRGDYKDTQTTEKRFPPALFTVAWEDEAWRIWRYRASLPRAMFVRSYIVRTDSQAIIDAIYDNNMLLGETVILEQEPKASSFAVYSGTESSLAAITAYGLNSVVVSTASPTDGFVLLTDNYYPGWRATVDGKPSEIYRADWTFRAVWVPKGEHTVVFTYAPRTVAAGAITAAAGLLLSAAVVTYGAVCRKKDKRNDANRNPGLK